MAANTQLIDLLQASLDQKARELIRQYVSAKRVEDVATTQRVEIGNKLAALLGAPEEGSETHTVGDVKVKLTQPVNRRADLEAIEALGLEHAPIRTKRELDVVGLKWLRENDPESFAKVAAHVTSTPGRVSIEIKEPEEK